MSSLDGQSSDNQYPVIVAGGAKVLPFEMEREDCDPSNRFVDISAASEIKAVFLKSDNTFLEKTLSGSGGITITNGPFGKFQIALSTADTNSLALSPVVDGVAGLSDIELHLTLGGEESIYNLLGVVQIVARRYPGAA